MATPRYPRSLPGPSTYILAPSAQGLGSDNEAGPEALRRRSRQPGATAQVTFRYPERDYATFKTWWEDRLAFGHRWFLINLPSAGGITWHYVRFADRYRARLAGHRSWEVSATLELRDRAFAPVVLDFALTLVSAFYPIPIVDELDPAASLDRGYVLAPTSDHMESTAALTAGALTVVVSYLTHAQPAESFDNTAALQAGTLDVVVAYLTYSNPKESFDNSATITAGSLTVVVAYLDYAIPTESLDNSASLLSGTLA